MEDVRTRVIHAIRELAEQLKAAKASNPDSPMPADVDDARKVACACSGISESAYRQTIDEEPALTELEKTAITEAVAGTTDPGPHDAISRESPSGQPGDLEKNRSESARVLQYR